MKTTILLLVSCILPTTVLAEDSKKEVPYYKNEFSLGMGFTRNFILNTTENIPIELLSKDFQEEINALDKTGLNLSYKHYLNQRFAIGGTFFYKSLYKTRDASIDDQTLDNQSYIEANYSQDYYGLALEGTITYFRKRKWQLYGLIGAGAYLCKEKTLMPEIGKSTEWTTRSYTKATYQITPFGFQVGKRWAFKCELGYGYKGVLSMEVSYRFKRTFH